jgi:hypothetical protein
VLATDLVVVVSDDEDRIDIEMAIDTKHRDRPIRTGMVWSGLIAQQLDLSQ